MPYRRLPNTDASRIHTLKAAVDKYGNTDLQQSAVNAAIMQEAGNILSRFESVCRNYRESYDTLIKANKILQQKTKNARLYLSHFIQVLYMCVQRSEIRADQLLLYGLDASHLLIPDMSTYELLLEWSKKIIEGEESRILRGGVPIYNPTISKVKVIVSLFEESYRTHQICQKNMEDCFKEVVDLRSSVDRVICEIWNQVEDRHKHLPASERYARNCEYGVIYYKRKGEADGK